ncbi:RICIN domain-containing protein [Actinocorallia populi]|uniref:RICIN domain-containing protein n=1 Tax=Actinocorallia populi TaxID=2079200 RepID=UPI000D0917FA|nr:RICIN domain-containing protein [Actinocorallia populi]
MATRKRGRRLVLPLLAGSALLATLTPAYAAHGRSAAAVPTSNAVMLVNAQTGKCLTIAGGRSTENNVRAVQFDCDTDRSRRWVLNRTGRGQNYQIRNLQTRKCLTIAGGRSTENNVRAVQYNCDRDRSRTWTIRQVASNGQYQIRNRQTGKCLTIAGGRSTENNVEALQYTCDDDTSRRWLLRLTGR